MQVAIDSFAALLPDEQTGLAPTPAERMANLLDEIETADRAGVDVFGIGEHQRKEFVDATTAIILAAAAARTEKIRLTSSVTVLGATDPVRVFQDYAAIDLISKGRAEITVGRGAFHEAFPLYGVQNEDSDALFAEKLDLLLRLRETNHLHWKGRYRPELKGQGVYPRPLQAQLPIWIGVGGTRHSFIRAGMLGLPLMVAIIGGSIEAFRPMIDLYRQAGRQAGHAAEVLKVGIHVKGFVADTDVAARDAFFPGWHHTMSTLGAERGWRAPSRAQFDAMCGPGSPYLIGNPRTVAAKMQAVSDALGGLDRITFEMSSASPKVAAMQRAIVLLGTEVGPLLRQHSRTRELA